MGSLGESPKTRSGLVAIADRSTRNRGPCVGHLGRRPGGPDCGQTRKGEASSRASSSGAATDSPRVKRRYGSHLYSEIRASALAIQSVPPSYDDDSPTVNGFEVINSSSKPPRALPQSHRVSARMSESWVM